MTCREFIEFLLDYVQGNLPPEAQARFDEHLTICPDCVNYLASYRTTADLERLASAEENLPAGVPEELIQAILAARQTSP